MQDAGFVLNKPTKYRYILVADRGMAEITGEAFIPFTVASITRVVRVLYVPRLSSKLILGLDFWKRFHLRADFVDNIVEASDLKVGFKEPPACNQETKQEDKENNQPSDQEDNILNKKQKEELEEILAEFRPKLDTGKLGCLKNKLHRVETETEEPLKQRYSSLNPRLASEASRGLDERLAMGIVEPSESPYSSPLLLIPKKDGGYRWVVDFRQLNQQIKRPNAHPLPHIDPLLWNIKGGTIFSSIDVRDAYLQVPLDEDSKQKTAFTVPGRGLFQFTRLPAGLKDAAARWQSAIEEVLGNDPHVLVYMDDILLWSPNNDWEHHKNLIRKVFSKLADAGLTIKMSKCVFGRKRTLYLGHIIDRYGIRPNPEKIAAIVNFPTPRTARKLRQFLGLAGWLRKFVKNFSCIARPLYALLKKTTKFHWGEEEEVAFTQLKERLCSEPVLRTPDFSLPFKIFTDASAVGTGAVLTQDFPDGEHVVAYTSRSLKGRESKYSATELECLGVLHAVEAFRPFVEGYRFDLITDHSSLRWLLKLKNPSGRLARWAVQLQAYDMNIIHRSGAQMQGPDALSRNVVSKEDPPAVSLIDLPDSVEDPWYLSLKSKIEAAPEEYEHFKIVDGRVFKLINVGRLVPMRWVQLIPRECRLKLMQQCHDDPKSGHGGVYKTFARVRLQGYWPGMQGDIVDYVKKCDICQFVKTPRQAPAGFMQSKTVISKPFEVMSTDLITKMPRSSKGNTVLSVSTDYFSKYIFLKPFRSEKAQQILDHLKNDIFLVHGAPRILIADNGAQYRSKKFQDLCAEFQIEVRYNLAYNPRSNFTERYNGTVRDMIRAYAKDNQKTWDLFVPEFQHALRTGISAATGFSPHQIVFGEEMVIDGRQHLFKAGDAELLVDDTISHAEAQKRLEMLRTEVQDRLRLAQHRGANRYNLRRREDPFKPGDLVLRKNFVKSNKAKGFNKKLASKFLGPFKIKKKLGNTGYLLEDAKGKEDGPWHPDQMRKYFS